MKHLGRMAALAVTLVCVGLSLATSVAADSLSVTDDNSTIRVDPHSDDGLNRWVVDGSPDHMFQQWFWFRIGDAGPESSLDDLPLAHHEVHGTDTIHLRYADQFLAADILYTLFGGAPGSGASAIGETVTLTNLGATHFLNLHWFEYTDLDLNGSSAGDAAAFVGPDTITQTEGATFSRVTGIGALGPLPTKWAIGSFAGLLTSLNNGTPTELANAVSPFGPGDATHAFQYDLEVVDSVTIVKAKHIEVVPEPGTLALFGLGGVGAALARRRRRRKATGDR